MKARLSRFVFAAAILLLFAVTRQRPFCRCTVRCAMATLVAQFFGCIRSVLPMTVSAISL